MKPKKSVQIRISVAKPGLVKIKHEAIVKEVLQYIKQNYATLDLTLNPKRLDKRM